MTVKSDYTSGTISLTNGSATVTGSGTAWAQPGIDVQEGDTLLNIPGAQGFNGAVIAAAVSDTELTLVLPWEGPTLAGVTYRLRFQPDGSRVKAESRNLIEMLSGPNILAFQALDGTGGDKIPMFTGTGAMTVIDRVDLTSGVHYDVQVDTLPDRDAYDAEPAGFSVLVSDVGDGRSAIYSKVTNALADWSAPAYITGPVGPLPDVEVGTTTTLPPGSPATVTPTPIPGGVELDFGIPAGEGFYWEGTYNPANSYDKDDVTRLNGTSFIALQAVPPGEQPSGAFPPVDTAFWAVLASKGQDGTGTGDMVGPNSAADGNIVAFDGSTGKLTKDSGVLAASVVVGPASAADESLAVFDGASGKLLKDGGVLVSQVVLASTVGLLSGFRNKIINGNFDLWQRGTSQTSSGYGSDDRWLNLSSGSTKTHTRQAFAPGQTDVPGNPRFFSRTVVTAGVGAGDVVTKVQKIEGVGTLAGEKATVTFWAKADAPKNISVSFYQVFGTGGTPSATVGGIGSTKFAVTASWQKFSFTVDIPSISGKTLGTNGDDALQLNIWFDAGSTFDSVTGSLGHQSGTFDISRVSVVPGDATAETDPSAPRHIQQETDLCERYYQILAGYQRYLASAAGNWSETVAFRQVMRAAPTITLGGSPLTNNMNNESIAGSSVYAVRWAMQSMAAGDCYILGRLFLCDAEL